MLIAPHNRLKNPDIFLVKIMVEKMKKISGIKKSVEEYSVISSTLYR